MLLTVSGSTPNHNNDGSCVHNSDIPIGGADRINGAIVRGQRIDRPPHSEVLAKD